MSEELTQSLLALLGTEGLIALAEKFGGRRLYVPQNLPPDHPLVETLGTGGAGKLAKLYSLAYIRVPLARALRARHYRAAGCSNGEIATKLGMTESGIDAMFERMDRKPAKGSKQLALDL